MVLFVYYTSQYSSSPGGRGCGIFCTTSISSEVGFLLLGAHYQGLFCLLPDTSDQRVEGPAAQATAREPAYCQSNQLSSQTGEGLKRDGKKSFAVNSYQSLKRSKYRTGSFFNCQSYQW